MPKKVQSRNEKGHVISGKSRLFFLVEGDVALKAAILLKLESKKPILQRTIVSQWEEGNLG